MGSSAHLAFETLSALADGELDQSERRAIAQHLRACEECSAELASIGRLESALAAPAAVDCPTALSFLSANQDRELTFDEELIAGAHVAGCATCRADAKSWRHLDASLASLPAAQPSQSVDEAVRDLAGRARGGHPTFGRGLVSGVAVRAAVAVGLVIAVAVAGIQEPGRQPATQSPESAQLPLPPIAPRQVIVASAQQALLNPRTNTYFVAYPDDGKVNVLDATSLADVASIDVGGHPNALALNEHDNTVLVLDSTHKILSEIDADTNTLIGQTPINTAGTPTTMQVDPANGRILIAVTEPTSPQSATPSGAVVVLDSSSKKLETTSAVAVAPRQVVADARGDRALLVSADVVTVVDAATFKPLDQLPGGVGAVFSAKSDTVAVLSATGTGTRVTIVGDENASLNLLGSPVAIIALPQGGYAVLTDETLNGRITEIAADGAPGRTTNVSLVGRELTYNARSGVYAVAGSGGIAIATIAGQVAISTPAPVAVNAKPSATDKPSSAKPGGSSAPASAIAPTANAPRPERVDSGVPAGATLAWAGVYRLELPDRDAPEVVGHGRAGHLWFVDAANRLTSVDAATGQTYTIAELPAAAKIRSIEVGSQFVYAIDIAASRVYIISLQTEKFSSLALPFIKSSDAVTITPDDVLWFAVADQILRLDPRTNQTEAADIGLYTVGAMAADSAGRVWFSDEGHQRIGLYDRRNHSVAELALPRKGSVTSMVVDNSGTLVVGTDAGEIFAIQNSALVGSSLVGRPVVSLVLDPLGNAWYLSDDSRQAVLGAARLKSPVRQLPATVVGVWFDARANAWLADRTSSGFFIAVPEAR